MSTKISQILSWLDDHILLILAGFLIAFIPLYPKLPLFEAIPGYIVRVRLEDVFVLFAALVWLIQALRQKIRWRSIVFWLIALYAVSGLLSILSAIFLIHTVPLQTIHIAKTVLHFFRYMEYFSLFLITFSAIRSKKDVQILVNIFIFTMLAVAVYGYGQKYHYWPVYSTMNREFSKGMRLYLTEHARVQSTFGGHYDLAAYLVILLNLTLALAFKHNQVWQKIYYYGVHLVGLWLLLMTASRTSFIAYLFGALVVIVLVAKEQKGWWPQLRWGIGRFISLILISGIMLLAFGDDMHERFLHVIKAYPQVYQVYISAAEFGEESVEKIAVVTGLKQEKKPPPENSLSLDEVLTETDQRPVSEKPDEDTSKSRPDDVYVDVPVTEKVATKSADGTTSYTYVQKDRTWSDNALRYGLSTAIRLDTLWPNAVQGFLKNPLLGSGYATLNKETVYQFTEAESTDNNFLRTLGETGLLGFVSFYGIILVSIYLAYKFHEVDQTYTSAISVGFIGASLGLLLNAAYIDVFAASKVAFTYWAVTGLVLGLYYLGKNQQKLKNTKAVQWYKQVKNKLGFN
jgi:hypothetical protein